MINVCDENEELMPHLNVNHSYFTLFNLYNQYKSNPDEQNKYLKEQIFKRVSQPYEKHFLKDEEFFVERTSVLKEQIDSLLNMNL